MCDDSLVLFQYTVSLTHTINSKGLEKLKDVHDDPACRRQKWKLVFVVPETQAAEVKPQSYMPTDKSEYWETRIDQYVLGLSPNELWPKN